MDTTYIILGVIKVSTHIRIMGLKEECEELKNIIAEAIKEKYEILAINRAIMYKDKRKREEIDEKRIRIYITVKKK